jgi:hypothetical protein
MTVLLTSIASASSCGIAYLRVFGNGQTIGVVEKSCATGYYSFGHEIAHMYGASHNIEAGTNPYYTYGYGYLMRPPVNSGLRTIMA